MRHVLRIDDLTKRDIVDLLDRAEALAPFTSPDLLKGKLVACCFFEPSTRTRLSFETAAYRLGAKVIGFSEAENTSVQKGETLEDTIRVVSSYADVIVLRHPEAGAAWRASQVSSVPVINAGDGYNQHPTQTLLDLYSIRQCQNKLDQLHITLAGDLYHGRTVHSLAKGLAHFNVQLSLVAPKSLQMPSDVCADLQQAGIPFVQYDCFEPILDKTDIIYMTRLQKERINQADLGAIDMLTITPELVKRGKQNLRILHPLPRVGEIDTAVDAMPQAYYFQQAAQGVPVRQALLSMLLSDLAWQK